MFCGQMGRKRVISKLGSHCGGCEMIRMTAICRKTPDDEKSCLSVGPAGQSRVYVHLCVLLLQKRLHKQHVTLDVDVTKHYSVQCGESCFPTADAPQKEPLICPLVRLLTCPLVVLRVVN